jgi:hypothetical protein
VTTVYDWLTVAIFAGLAVIYLQRSAGERPAHDAVWKYLPPAALCMFANQMGNADQRQAATLLMIGALAYVWFVIRPLDRA